MFTFGCGHEHAGHYVRIHGTFSEARAEMVRRFGRDWAFQYTEEEWDRAVQDLRMNGYGMMVETEMEVDWDD